MALTVFEGSTLEELIKLYEAKPGLMDTIVVGGGRRWGKSRLGGVTTDSVSGSAPDLFIFDEWQSGNNDSNHSAANSVNPNAGALRRFADPRFPSCRCWVHEKPWNRHDPRNPNPGAPPTRSYVLKVVGRVSAQSYPALQLAEGQAKLIHETLVARLIQDEQSRNPNFGRFG